MASSVLQNLVTGALPSVIDTVTIASNFSPPYSVKVADLAPGGAGGPPPTPYLKIVRPTVVLSGGSAGTQTIAPGGQPDPDAWKRNLAMAGGALALLVAGVGAMTFGLGVHVGKKRRR